MPPVFRQYYHVPPIVRVISGVAALVTVMCLPFLISSSGEVFLAIFPIMAGTFAASIAIFGRSSK